MEAIVADVIECTDCGLRQKRAELGPRQSAHCAACGVALYEEKPGGVQAALALTVAALLLLAIANFTDFMTFELKGRSQGNKIITGVIELVREGYWPLGLLIFFASVVAPLLHLTGMLCVLLPVHLERSPGYLGPLFRRLGALRPWSMLEVYLLGIFVAVVKLSQLASIELGIAFWAYLALIVVAAASYDALDERDVWDVVRLQRAEEAA
jgi:paraquat-inducible protein A